MYLLQNFFSLHFIDVVLSQGDGTSKSSVYLLCGCLDILIVISLVITVVFMDDIKEDTDGEPIEKNKLNSKRICKYDIF